MIGTNPREATRRKTIRDRMAITGKNFDRYAGLFATAVNLAVKHVRTPVLGRMLKKIVLMDHSRRHLTQSITLDLNYPLHAGHADESLVLPIEIIRRTIREASFIAIMHKCLCRTGNSCRTFEADLGCIFVGRAARVVVDNEIARRATVEEALAHVDRAAKAGLVGMCLWIEAEKYIWGFSDRDLDKFIEICFCCPCCCLALRNLRRVPEDVQRRFRSAGWQAVLRSDCDGCGCCVDQCPAGALAVVDSVVTVSDGCLGCGLCVGHCPQRALSISMTGMPKERVQDCFYGFRPDIESGGTDLSFKNRLTK